MGKTRKTGRISKTWGRGWENLRVLDLHLILRLYAPAFMLYVLHYN